MYGLPKDFDTSIFLGKTIQAISFSANTIDFMFDDALSITATGSFSHHIPGQNSDEVESIPVKNSKLMQLTEKSVVSAKVEGRGNLVLQFNDGQILRCIDDTPRYESYSITYHSKETFV